MTAPPWSSCPTAITCRRRGLPGPLGHIAALGANIGLLRAGLAGRYPHARLLGAGTLLGEFSGQAPVDHLLVNIESAWYDMLRHGEWTHNVRCIKIEIQDHYDEAVPLLEARGYQARLQWLNWGAFVTGIRR